MQFCIKHSPVFSVLEIQLSDSEKVIAQPNSMLSMTSGLELTASVGRRGSSSGAGWFGGIKNALGGESVFTAEFRAKRDDQVLMLAPDSQGDILTIALNGSSGFFLARGAYLANIGDCEVAIKYGGIKGMMAKTGLFLLHAVGTGTVFCQSYGAIVEKELVEGENFFVDNRYMVAFADTVQYQLVKATRSVKDAVLSGEGLIVKYTGPGKVFYQTRGKPPVGWLSAFLGAAF